MQRQKPSATTPGLGWRRAKLVASSLALTLGAFGTVAAVNALPASAAVGTVTSNAYTIGSPSGSVTSPTVSPTSALAGQSTSYTVTFVSPSAIASGGTVTIGDSTTNNSVAASASGVTLVSGSCLQSGGNANSAPSGTVITLNTTSCSAGVAAGATVTVGFSGTNPGSATSFNFTVATSANATSAKTGTVTISSSPPSLSAASLSLGVNTTYTISDVGATSLNTGTSESWSTLTGTAGVLELDASNAGVSFFAGNASYTVTYTPSGGTATTDVVTAATPGATPNIVYLTLTTAIASGGVVNITALVTNPATSGSTTVSIAPGNGTGASFVNAGPATPLVTGSISFGTAVTAVTLSISPLVAAASATYTVTFKATTAVTGGPGSSISLTETAGPTNFKTVTGVLVSDATANWRFVSTLPGGSGGISIPIPSGDNIAAGDAITVTVASVTNPGAGTYTDFGVSTSKDTVQVAAPAYTISASGTAGITVVPNPNTVGSLATYTITGLFANAAITGGTTTCGITLTAPAGTTLPNSAGSYVITDSTTASGSGTVGTATGWNGTSISITPPNSIASGDALTITIGDVINPSAASSALTMSLTGCISGQTGVAPFPRANTSYPNGALINFAGTIYVFAGGHGFGIPTPTVLNKIRAVDPAVPLNAPAGAVPPTAGSRSGTLISTYAVNGNATIYVVGTDGEAHGFSTPKQLISFGYDTRTNVTTNNLGGMTVGSTEGQLGAAKGNAYATASDGAIIDSSGTYYTFIGGRAWGIPTPARLAQIMAFYTGRKYTPPTTLTGTISSANTGASVASGVLPSVSPAPTSSVTNATVYVSFVGNVFPFKTQKQLANDGYGGTASLPAVNTGGLPVVSTYTSS